MKPTQGSDYIHTLDGWRCLAIVAVIAFHATISLFYPSGPFPSYEGRRIAIWGGRGVEVFFALSGFLICSRLLAERQKTGTISLLAFYVRRAFRILPPYISYLALLAVLTAAGALAVKSSEFVGCLLFIRNYYPGSSATVDGGGWYTAHFWSLAVEEHFYFVWPLLLLIAGNRSARPVALVLAMLVPVWQSVSGLGNFRTDTQIHSLFWGCWVALLLAEPRIRAWAERWLTPAVWLGIAAALALLVRFGPVGEEPAVSRHVEAFLMPWLIAGTVLHPGWRLSRLLEWAPIRWIGRLSYSLYIWQQLWLPGVGNWDVAVPPPFGPFQTLPLNLLCILGCAVASYYLIERPMLRVGGRLAKRFNGGGPPISQTELAQGTAQIAQPAPVSA